MARSLVPVPISIFAIRWVRGCLRRERPDLHDVPAWPSRVEGSSRGAAGVARRRVAPARILSPPERLGLARQFSGLTGYPAGPASAATLAAGAFLGRKVVRAVSSSRAPRRPVRVPRAVAVAPETDTDHLGEAKQKRAVRIAGVQAALAQLDAEWLSYEMDLDAYYLTKPLLRDPAVAQTAAYRSALYELRTLAEGLGKSSTVAELDEAEQAAEAALMAWGAANDHALAIGLSDRSPTERAALRRLHALTAQLADPSTPKPMWPSLIDTITREMSKLTTVPASWDHLSRVPALEQRNPVAIAATSSE